MNRTYIVLPAAALMAVSACATLPAPTPTNQNFNDLRQSYPDLSAVEFGLLDENNDGFVDAVEAQNINNDNDPDGLDISDD